MKEKSTRKAKTPEAADELRPEYDRTLMKNAVRAKYTERYQQGTNLVRLAPDVAAVFPNDDAVDKALRLVMRLAADAARLTEPTHAP